MNIVFNIIKNNITSNKLLYAISEVVFNNLILGKQ